MYVLFNSLRSPEMSARRCSQPGFLKGEGGGKGVRSHGHGRRTIVWGGVPMLAGMPLMNESVIPGSTWVSVRGTANGKGGGSETHVAARAGPAQAVKTRFRIIADVVLVKWPSCCGYVHWTDNEDN